MKIAWPVVPANQANASDTRFARDSNSAADDFGSTLAKQDAMQDEQRARASQRSKEADDEARDTPVKSRDRDAEGADAASTDDVEPDLAKPERSHARPSGSHSTAAGHTDLWGHLSHKRETDPVATDRTQRGAAHDGAPAVAISGHRLLSAQLSLASDKHAQPTQNEDGPGAALATQLLDDSSRVSARSLEGRRRIEGIPVDPNNPSALDASEASQSDGRNAIAGTTVIVREQQTHFSHNRVGRTASESKGAKPDPIAGASRKAPAPRQDTEQPSVAKAEDTASIAHLSRAADDADSPSDESATAHSSTLQVLSKLLDTGGQRGGAATAEAPSPAWASNEKPFGSLIRQLRLELSPGSLGVVHITLKGANASLSISIAAEHAATAASLNEDRSVLSAQLTGAGYTIDDLIVTTLDTAQPPSRSEQTAQGSLAQFAGGSNDPQQRQTDDAWQRQQSEGRGTSQHTSHGVTSEDQPMDSGVPPPSPTAWRGRRMPQSV